MAKKTLTGVIIVMVAIIFGNSPAWSWLGQKKETIKIGAILPLSGASSQVGEAQRDGLRLAVDEINTWEGINGKKIELLIEDSKTDKVSAKDEVTPFMQLLINNELSGNLREKFIGFGEKEYGCRVFSEIIITNKYGANAAQTEKTTDYYQADEK